MTSRALCGDCGRAWVTMARTHLRALCAGCAFWKGLDHAALIVPDGAIDRNVYVIDILTDELTDPPVWVTRFDGTQLGPVRRLRCLGVECGREGRPPANAILDNRYARES